MIEKLIKIQGIGLFSDAVRPAIELKDSVLIYAENSRGKTTFSTICNSLRCNSPKELIERKTISNGDKQNIELLIDSASYKFSDSLWSDQYKNIKVYNSDFIEKNVYSGGKLDPQQRENLLEFVLGEKGVSLKTDIDVINEKIKLANQDLKGYERVIDAITENLIPINEFVSMKEQEGLERLVVEKESELKNLKNIETIEKRPELVEVTLTDLNFESLENLLSASLKTITEDAVQSVQRHIEENLDDSGEQWIGSGLEYIKENNCPFCGQSIEQNELVDAYKKYFDKSYEQLKDSIGKLKTDLGSTFSDRSLDSVIDAIENNSEITISYWEDKKELFNLPNLNKVQILKIWRELKAECFDILNKKTKQPLSELCLSEKIKKDLEEYNSLKKCIDDYNSKVANANNKIKDFKKQLDATNLSKVEQDLALLKIKKKRFSENSQGLCSDYLSAQANKKRFEEEKKQKREALEKYTENVLDKYEKEINSILEDFGASFKIIKLVTDHTAGVPRTKYFLKILSQPFDASQKIHLLGEGDRRTLAFAFFIACLKNERIDNQVLVIDDPVSSLDIHRRNSTITEVEKLVGKCKQLIILSHDPFFLRDLSKKINPQVLLLKRNGEHSIFDENLDIYEECKGKYYVDYEKLINFIETGASNNQERLEVAKTIRPYLEGNLRRRYPAELKRKLAGNLGKMITLIREAKPDNPLNNLKDKLEALNQINEFAVQLHHDQEDEGVILSDSEVRTNISKALEIGYSA